MARSKKNPYAEVAKKAEQAKKLTQQAKKLETTLYGGMGRQLTEKFEITSEEEWTKFLELAQQRIKVPELKGSGSGRVADQEVSDQDSTDVLTGED